MPIRSDIESFPLTAPSALKSCLLSAERSGEGTHASTLGSCSNVFDTTSSLP